MAQPPRWHQGPHEYFIVSHEPEGEGSVRVEVRVRPPAFAKVIVTVPRDGEATARPEDDGGYWAQTLVGLIVAAAKAGAVAYVKEHPDAWRKTGAPYLQDPDAKGWW